MNNFKWFYPHIPPSFYARPIMKDAIGKEIFDLSEIYGDDSVNNPNVSYRINSLGYRSSEFSFKESQIILSFGMSSTFGIGVSYKETYTNIISEYLKIPSFNMGVPGASSDTVSRTISCTIPFFKQYNTNLIVLVGWPYSLRREVFTDTFKASINFQDTPPIKEYYKLLDDTANDYNQEKNILMVRTVCSLHNSQLVEIPESLYLNLDIDKSNDGFHPGPMWNKKIADWILNQLK